jgi:hypothetical protein
VEVRPATLQQWIYMCCCFFWVHGDAVGWGTESSRVSFLTESQTLILITALWHWARFSLQQKWVPGLTPGGKGDRCLGLTAFPPSCADCLKFLGAPTSWSHNALPKPVQRKLKTCYLSLPLWNWWNIKVSLLLFSSGSAW